jgi:tetratricopeptide (TPR) repeat protein
MIAALAVLALALANPSPQAASIAAPQAQSLEQLMQSAEKARDENRDDDAIRLYESGLKSKPDWDEGLWYLGTLFYEKERFAEARDLLRHFVAQNPKHGPAWAILGMSEFQTREYDRALDHLQRAMSIGVADRKELANSVFYHVAVLLTRFEQYDDSMSLLFAMRAAGQADAILVEPEGLAALRYPLLPQEIPEGRRELVRMAGTGAFALIDQRRGDAEKTLSKMAESYPAEPGVHFLYGVLLMDSRPQDGVREIKRELEISPSHIPARLRLATYYLKESQTDQTMSLAQEVLKLDAKNAAGHSLLGEALASKGDTAGAIRELETARGLSPDTVSIHWSLLRAYTAAGRKEDATKEKAEIERLSKGSPAK